MPAGYRLYGAQSSDFFIDAAGTPQPDGTATVWTEEVSGTRVITLLDASEDAVDHVTADNFGNYRFWAPDDLPSLLWVDGGVGIRYAALPIDIGLRMDAAEEAGFGVNSMAQLTDVNLTTIADGQLLEWDITTQKFIPTNRPQDGNDGDDGVDGDGMEVVIYDPTDGWPASVKPTPGHLFSHVVDAPTPSTDRPEFSIWDRRL